MIAIWGHFKKGLVAHISRSLRSRLTGTKIILCDILPGMNSSDEFHTRLSGWLATLRTRGLDGVAVALLDAAEPLAPLGAGVLWIAQPALGLFMPRNDIGGLAQLLDDPAGIAWLRDELTGSNGSTVSKIDEER